MHRTVKVMAISLDQLVFHLIKDKMARSPQDFVLDTAGGGFVTALSLSGRTRLLAALFCQDKQDQTSREEQIYSFFAVVKVQRRSLQSACCVCTVGNK